MTNESHFVKNSLLKSINMFQVLNMIIWQTQWENDEILGFEFSHLFFKQLTNQSVSQIVSMNHKHLYPLLPQPSSFCTLMCPNQKGDNKNWV